MIHMNTFTNKLRPVFIALLMGMVTLNVNAQTNIVLNFDGIDDYVNISNSVIPYDTILSQTYTVEAWANIATNTGVLQAVVTSGGLTSNGYQGFGLFALPDGNWYIAVGTGASTPTYLVGNAISYGTWTHLAATYDGTTLKFYVNAVLVNSLVVSIIANTTLPTRIGAGNNQGAPLYFFGGNIDDVAFWNAILTPAGIASTMNHEYESPLSGMLAYYNFNEGIPNGNNATPSPGVNTLVDITANHISGTLYNFFLNGDTSNWINASLLPVDLLSFTGTKHDAANLLEWSTATEENSNYFEVQRSTDGVTFTDLARVAASGNSNIVRNYQYNDNEISSLTLVYYYRLEMVDIDGNTRFSNIIFIKNSLSGATTIYPNPAVDKISINTSDQSLLNTPASLNDITGKTLQVFTIQQSNTEINISNFAKGIYVLRFIDGSSVKFVKE